MAGMLTLLLLHLAKPYIVTSHWLAYTLVI